MAWAQLARLVCQVQAPGALVPVLLDDLHSRAHQARAAAPPCAGARRAGAGALCSLCAAPPELRPHLPEPVGRNPLLRPVPGQT